MSVTTPSLGQKHFGAACLGDARRTERLVLSADLIGQHPGGSLPEKFRSPAALDGFYRLVNQSRVTHDAVLKPHCVLTLQTMSQHAGTVLVIHDSTELDYTGKTSIPDLGQIGNGSRRGYLCMNSLAVDASQRAVLGLANQILYRRPKASKHETRHQRRTKEQRETRLWKQAAQAVGTGPEQRRWVHVSDCASDVFEYLDDQHRRGGLYLVRAWHDRWILRENQGESERCKLFAFARGLPELGGRYVAVPARDGQPARVARVRVGAGPLSMPAPKNPRGEHGTGSLRLWVVWVREVEPPAGVEPLEWILLTNVAVENLDDACERIDWYTCRWVVEEFHKAQKTGCGIEQPQLTTRAALEPTIALLSVVAVWLVQMRDICRGAESNLRLARDVVPGSYVAVLSGWRFQEVRMELTVHEFYYAVARLGGHQNRKGDGPPGWITIWRGWTQLEAMVAGAAAVGFKKCEET